MSSILFHSIRLYYDGISCLFYFYQLILSQVMSFIFTPFVVYPEQFMFISFIWLSSHSSSGSLAVLGLEITTFWSVVQHQNPFPVKPLLCCLFYSCLLWYRLTSILYYSVVMSSVCLSVSLSFLSYPLFPNIQGCIYSCHLLLLSCHLFCFILFPGPFCSGLLVMHKNSPCRKKAVRWRGKDTALFSLIFVLIFYSPRAM